MMKDVEMVSDADTWMSKLKSGEILTERELRSLFSKVNFSLTSRSSRS